MPDMFDIRYTHTSTFVNNRLYVLGGREFGDDTNGPLDKCEFFDFEYLRWIELEKMRYRRATPFSVIHGGYIYVFGGYTGLY